MKRTLQILALVVVLATGIVWLATGANRGWTRTSVEMKTLDEVTGIEGIEYRKRFVPGVDFLGAALLGAGLLAGASLLFRNRPISTIKNMKSNILTLIALATLSAAAWAEPQSFNFKDPKGVNNAVFKLDAPLEAITGSASGVSGTVTFDPENPAATTGKIVVAASSLHVTSPMMKEHMHGEQWLDVTKHSEITFEAKELKNVKSSGNETTADAVGVLTIKGVAKEITAPVKLTYLKDKLGSRVPKLKGDLLVIRSTFPIKRSDFGINPGAPQDKVADTIDLTLSIAGAAPRS
jgi:polyisoprenoid-binding protein YceI